MRSRKELSAKKLTVTREQRKKRSLKESVAKITAKDRHVEIPTGPECGKERLEW